MKLCIFANCQGDGIARFVKKVLPGLNISVWHNWQVILGEQDGEEMLRDVADCDFFLYQPTAALKNGRYSSEEVLALVPKSSKKISFAYQFNTGFFPIVHHGGWHTGQEVIEKATRGLDVVRMFDEDRLFYDCARRFAENLAEQSRREESCDLKFVPYILNNFQRERLFLVCNHPTSVFFEHMARVVLREIGFLDHAIPIESPNETNLPGNHPVHLAVARELGLQYREDDPKSDKHWYRHLMQKIQDGRGAA